MEVDGCWEAEASAVGAIGVEEGEAGLEAEGAEDSLVAVVVED